MLANKMLWVRFTALNFSHLKIKQFSDRSLSSSFPQEPMESSTSLQQAIHLIQTLVSKSNLSHSGDYRGRPSDCLSLGISVLNSWGQVMINHTLTIGLKVKQWTLETKKLQISLQPSFTLRTVCF